MGEKKPLTGGKYTCNTRTWQSPVCTIKNSQLNNELHTWDKEKFVLVHSLKHIATKQRDGSQLFSDNDSFHL